VYLELKNEIVYQFYELDADKIDSIKTYCFQYGSLIITRRTIFNKNIVQKLLWPILFHLEFIFIDKILYGKPYCDVNIVFFLLFVSKLSLI